MKRRSFLQSSVVATTMLASLRSPLRARPRDAERGVVVVSTWDHGMPANEAALTLLGRGGSALDAVEAGVRVTESDPKVTSVGYGGFPDRDGRVTLDACIMDERGRAGSVACLEHIMNPISVARKVMETTPHVMLVGEGAYRFAIQNGFKHENLLSEEARKAWEEWKAKSGYRPPVGRDNHDTIGLLARDAKGNLSGACTTSGLAWKLHGRVGDSPIIGAGLFVDNEVGAACATGKGESVIRVAGSAIIVELMRFGRSPQEACEEAVRRIIRKQPDYADFQVGFLAMNKDGEIGAHALHKGFQFAHAHSGTNALHDSTFAN